MEFPKLNLLKSKLDSFRPLPSGVLKNIYENNLLEWTYNSNAMEGNTLTLKETKIALEGITVGGKLLREHFEAINHKEAILFVEEIAKCETPLSEYSIKSIHKLILKNIDDENAGIYRKNNVSISGARHKPPDFIFVPEFMEKFIAEYETKKIVGIHPVELSAWVHSELVKIHPFIDGNGRTARLIMNLELIKSGFPIAIIPISKRLEYYESLDASHCDGNNEPFLSLIAEIVEKSFEPYWNALGKI